MFEQNLSSGLFAQLRNFIISLFLANPIKGKPTKEAAAQLRDLHAYLYKRALELLNRPFIAC